MTSATASPDAAPRDRRNDRGKEKDRLWQRAVVGVLSASIWLIGALPPRVGYLAFDVLAIGWWLCFRFNDPRGERSKGYWRNVRIAFRPGSPLGAERPKRHLWRWSRHIAHVVTDFCLMRRLDRDNLEHYVDMSEYPPIAELYAEGKGVIFATGHVGAWDVAGVGAGLKGLPLTSVFRPSPIPALNRLIERLRTRTGQRVVARKRVMYTLKKVLSEGGAIGLLCDGGGKHSAVTAPFLGTVAKTVATPAVLHLSSGAPIVVVTVIRTGCMRFKLRVHDIIRETPSGDRDDDLRRIMTRVNDGLTEAVREAPEQWFWQGRRFRHRPAGETPGPDGLPPLADR